jgi:hypothetical protein
MFGLIDICIITFVMILLKFCFGTNFVKKITFFFTIIWLYETNQSNKIINLWLKIKIGHKIYSSDKTLKMSVTSISKCWFNFAY